MRYGATFKIEIYDFDNEKGEVIITRPSDYIQMQLWGDKNQKNLPEAAKDLYGNYAILYFALKREGRPNEYGFKDGPLTIEALAHISEHVSLFVSALKDDELPMRAQKK